MLLTRPSLDALRVVWITDGSGDGERIAAIAEAAAAGGLRAIQLREPAMKARDQVTLCERLRATLAPSDGLLLVNDRVDVAACAAHGAHLGRRSIPPSRAREIAGVGSVLGYSAHDAEEIAWAISQGVDYVSLSPVCATTSKPAVEPLGMQRAAALTGESIVPVVWLGGMDRRTAAAAAAFSPFGIASMSGIANAPDPAAEVRALREALSA